MGAPMAGRGFRQLVPEVPLVVHARNTKGAKPPVIVLGVILILVGYLLPVPGIIATIGWILLVIGLVLLVLGQMGRPVGGRRYWY
jgi:membrane-bound ClpP family serine protease